MAKKAGFRVLFCAVFFLFAMAGCATVGPAKPPEPPPVVQNPENGEKGWWYARFRMDWPEGAEPAWYADLILAQRVVAPALHRYGEQITLWRFHRRAARDQSGHQFSFIFYSSPETARAVYQAIRSNSLLSQMKESHIVTDEVYDETATVVRPRLEATSDPSWSPEIQRTWPFYIMGVSQMWLNLVGEVSSETLDGKEPSSLPELQDAYKKINETMKAIWQKEGSHAFLHHLNALFGYEPLIIYERRMMNF